MEYLVVIVVAPLAVWALDRFLYRGELAEAVAEAVGSTRSARRKARKTP